MVENEFVICLHLHKLTVVLTAVITLQVGHGKYSQIWSKVQDAFDTAFPGGKPLASSQTGKDNATVMSLINGTEGAIGYVDLSDAKDANLSLALIKNKAGKFVEPTLDGASAAAAGATVKDDLTFSTIWAEGDASYPITAQTWIIAYQHQKDAAKADALKAFLNFVLTEGQKIAPTVNYAALPADLAAKAIAQIASITVG